MTQLSVSEFRQNLPTYLDKVIAGEEFEVLRNRIVVANVVPPKKKIKKKINPAYIAQRDNEDFKFYKKIAILEEIHLSGIIDELWEKIAPEAIILYGSYSKGEATENSDIDLFVVSKTKKAIFDYKIEKRIDNREIHIIIDNVKNIPDKLMNSLINGIILKGYLKVL